MAKKHETIKVTIGEGLPAEKALRKFKRLCESYGIIKEYRQRKSYEKPSEKAKLKREAAEKRRHKTKRSDNHSRNF